VVTYTPEDVGMFRFYLTVATFFSVILSLSLDRLVFKIKDKREKKELISISIYFSLLMILLVMFTGDFY
ncbi:hypothetical protein, partial [Vibrio harveyi]|uniref:hypothetical protein n=1 Tax=Vibrio harveyi TaxID=669 RepID=UPI000AF65341